jgi:crossover junction endodeoxyribonuclease RuvC
MNNLFCGIDPSFSNTGVIVINNECSIIDQRLISTKKKDDIYDIERRMIFIVEDLSYFLTKYFKDLKLILIEGISYGSKGEASSQLAALNYFVRIFMLENNLPYGVISPTSLKKFVTGKGQCKKNLILKEVYKKWNMDFEDDNLADSYALSRMSQFNYNRGN